MLGGKVATGKEATNGNVLILKLKKQPKKYCCFLDSKIVLLPIFSNPDITHKVRAKGASREDGNPIQLFMGLLASKMACRRYLFPPIDFVSFNSH